MNLWRFDKKDLSLSDTLQFDWPMMLIVALLCLFGLLMVVSSSMDTAIRLYEDDEWFFARRQAFFLIAGLLVYLFIYYVTPSGLWFTTSPWHLLLVVLLLSLVIASPLGVEKNGSYRWLSLGLFNIQVSELAKLAVILYLSDYIHRHFHHPPYRWNQFMMPLLFVGLTAFLILLAPDYGTTTVIAILCLSMLFLAGLGFLHLLTVTISISVVIALLLRSCSYCMTRLASYQNPWEDPHDGGYQLIQSLIAIGRGEWLGVGPGNSMQKLSYLSEAHNDFIFSIAAEEFGFFGALFLVILYTVLIARCFIVGRRIERQPYNKAGAFFCYGVGVWFGLQAYGNMGVAVGLLPTKGLTLPLLSYGGSSVIVVFAMIAITQRLYCEMCQNDVVFMHRLKMRKSHV